MNESLTIWILLKILYKNLIFLNISQTPRSGEVEKSFIGVCETPRHTCLQVNQRLYEFTIRLQNCARICCKYKYKRYIYINIYFYIFFSFYFLLDTSEFTQTYLSYKNALELLDQMNAS